MKGELMRLARLELQDKTRAELLEMIRKVMGTLPFAIPLNGDDEDNDVPYVSLDQAADDDLREYVAFNYVRASVESGRLVSDSDFDRRRDPRNFVA